MKRHIPVLVLLGCAAGLALGLIRLFELRFEAGDVYPPYSSLRSDPLGTMAFYESLRRIPGISTGRDFSDQNRLPKKTHTVYLQLGGNAYDWIRVPGDVAHELDAYLARGNRLVIAFYPETSLDQFQDLDEGTNSASPAQSREKDERTKSEKPPRKMTGREIEDEEVNLSGRWGFAMDFVKLSQADKVYEPARVINKSDLPLPRTLAWHSGMVFTKTDSSWRVIYARGPDPVVIERHFGHGSVVMATDSYFASNEAMEGDRHADLLAWLIGPNDNIVFDESHFGIVENSGITMLMRQYRLQGLAAGFLLLAGLFIWKNGTSLVPLQVQREQQNHIAGRDSATGFINLLRRNIAPRDVLGICFAEWKKSFACGQFSSARRQQVEAVFQADNAPGPGKRNPIAAYRKICAILKIRNPSSKS